MFSVDVVRGVRSWVRTHIAMCARAASLLWLRLRPRPPNSAVPPSRALASGLPLALGAMPDALDNVRARRGGLRVGHSTLPAMFSCSLSVASPRPKLVRNRARCGAPTLVGARAIQVFNPADQLGRPSGPHRHGHRNWVGTCVGHFSRACPAAARTTPPRKTPNALSCSPQHWQSLGFGTSWMASSGTPWTLCLGGPRGMPAPRWCVSGRRARVTASSCRAF